MTKSGVIFWHLMVNMLAYVIYVLIVKALAHSRFPPIWAVKEWDDVCAMQEKASKNGSTALLLFTLVSVTWIPAMLWYACCKDTKQ